MPTRSCCACGVPFRVPTSERAATCYVTSLDPLKIPNVRVTFWVRRILAGERDITHMTVSAGTAYAPHCAQGASLGMCHVARGSFVDVVQEHYRTTGPS